MVAGGGCGCCPFGSCAAAASSGECGTGCGGGAVGVNSGASCGSTFFSSSGLSLRNIFFVGAFGGTTFLFSRWRSPFLTLLELL